MEMTLVKSLQSGDPEVIQTLELADLQVSDIQDVSLFKCNSGKSKG
jgi:hypothetical protein